MFWFRDVYHELHEHVMTEVEETNTTDASGVITRLMNFDKFYIARPHHPEAGARWRRWLVHAVVAISNVSGNNLKTLVDWIHDGDGSENSYSYHTMHGLL